MRIRYTAKRSINTAQDTVKIFNFGGADGRFLSQFTAVNRTDAFRIKGKVATYINGSNQSVVSVDGAFRFFITAEGSARIYRYPDSAGFTHTDLKFLPAPKENYFEFHWLGDGNYELWLNGEYETGFVTTPLTSLVGKMGIADWPVADYPLAGMVYDLRLWVNDIATGYWPAQEGTGTTLYDAIGNNDFILGGTGTPEPWGWSNFTPAHYDGDQYTADVILRNYDRSRKAVKSVVKSFSGIEQTTYQRADTFYNCATVPVQGAARRNMLEFLDSTEAGEQFEFDDGSLPTVWQKCHREGAYSESREIRRGDGGHGDFFTLSWKHRSV